MKKGLVKAVVYLSFALGGISLLLGLLQPRKPTPTPLTTPTTPTTTLEEGTPPPTDGKGHFPPELKKAVIQIQAEGSFEYPFFGEVDVVGRGSGFIIDESGLAVTNNHVVTGAALLKVWVGGDTTTTYNAEVLGVSECSDLAVIDIQGEGFHYLEWYEEQVTIGLPVYAAGYPLGEPGFTATNGAISKVDAPGDTEWASIDSVLMHNATINPGNSGGPLVNTDGKVVGINYSAKADFDQYFAIGKDIAIEIVDTLKTDVNVNSIGINGNASYTVDDGTGIWVYSVESGSMADQAGIKDGDFITRLENHPLAREGTMIEYCDIFQTHNPVSNVLDIEVFRISTGQTLEGQLNGRVLEPVD